MPSSGRCVHSVSQLSVCTNTCMCTPPNTQQSIKSTFVYRELRDTSCQCYTCCTQMLTWKDDTSDYCECLWFFFQKGWSFFKHIHVLALYTSKSCPRVQHFISHAMRTLKWVCIQSCSYFNQSREKTSDNYFTVSLHGWLWRLFGGAFLPNSSHISIKADHCYYPFALSWHLKS